jgi:hypothetical protein
VHRGVGEHVGRGHTTAREGGGRAGRERGQQRRAERAADLLHGVDERRGNTRVVRGHTGGGGVHRRGEDQAEPTAKHQQRRQHVLDAAMGSWPWRYRT